MRPTRLAEGALLRVPIASLKRVAGPKAGATTVVHMADGGDSPEVALRDAPARPNCIFSFCRHGGLGAILPDSPSNPQELGVIKVQGK